MSLHSNNPSPRIQWSAHICLMLAVHTWWPTTTTSPSFSLDNWANQGWWVFMNNAHIDSSAHMKMDYSTNIDPSSWKKKNKQKKLVALNLEWSVQDNYIVLRKWEGWRAGVTLTSEHTNEPQWKQEGGTIWGHVMVCLLSLKAKVCFKQKWLLEKGTLLLLLQPLPPKTFLYCNWGQLCLTVSATFVCFFKLTIRHSHPVQWLARCMEVRQWAERLLSPFAKWSCLTLFLCGRLFTLPSIWTSGTAIHASSFQASSGLHRWCYECIRAK